MTIYDTEKTRTDEKKYIVNQSETLLVQERQHKQQNECKDWIFFVFDHRKYLKE